jgi:asparagine synthase (glutamine-hydrolysing)
MDSTLRDESSLMYRVLSPGAVRGLLDDHQAGRADNHKLLFSLVVLEEWMRGNDRGFDRGVRRKSA